MGKVNPMAPFVDDCKADAVRPHGKLPGIVRVRQRHAHAGVGHGAGLWPTRPASTKTGHPRLWGSCLEDQLVSGVSLQPRNRGLLHRFLLRGMILQVE